MRLAELQERFFELATRAPDARPAAECFVSTPDLSAEERLDIYANMFVWRQIDALREDFPKLAQLLGDEGFYATAESYLRAHPSTHPSLAQLGRHFASFLAESPGPRPDLADLAGLEWARCEVFVEAHVLAATPGLVSGPDPAHIVLRTVPALRLLSLRHEVLSLWKDLDDGKAAPLPRAQPTAVAVWRKEFVVFHVGLAAEEASALRRAMSGATLGEICEVFAERDDAVQVALSAVASWFAEEWIAAPEGT
jgi:hypothetical protein